MLTFENANYFYLLLFLPIFIYLHTRMVRRRIKMLRDWGDLQIVERLQGQHSMLKIRSRLWATMLGFSFMVAALANPQWGTLRDKLTTGQADIFVALDLSQSMLAQDLQPTRLIRAQHFVEEQLQNWQSGKIDVSVSFLTFAGVPNVESPLTNDLESIEQQLRSVSPELMPSPGTRFQPLFDLMSRMGNQQTDRLRIALLVTDGEDHDENTKSALAKLVKEGFVLVTVGVGTEAGGKIPLGFTEENEPVWKQTQEGEEIVSKLNEPFLKTLAAEGRGNYFRVNEAAACRDYLDRLIRTGGEGMVAAKRPFKEFVSYYAIFAFLSLLVLALAFLVPLRTSGWLEQYDIFGYD
jgi:Ca-activated chloride channel homolog